MKISGNRFKTKMEDFAVDLDKVLDDFEQSEGMDWDGPLALSGIRWSLTLGETDVMGGRDYETFMSIQAYKLSYNQCS